MMAQRRFSCTESGCGKAFFRSEHLSRHRLNHRPKEVFQCNSCPKRFVRKDLLQRHEKRHERGMWFRNSGGVVKSNPEGDATEALGTSSRYGSSTTPPFSTDGTEEGTAVKGTGIEGILPTRQRHEMGPLAQSAGMAIPPPEEPVPLPVGIGMAGEQNSLFFDSSAEVQALHNEISWLFEDVPLNFSPTEPIGFNSLSSQNPPYIFPPATAPYHAAQLPPGSSLVRPDLSANSTIPRSAKSGGYTNTSATPWGTVRERLRAALFSLPPDVLESSFFHPDNLAHFFGLYFINYHPHFPILHPPTLYPAEAPPLLITAIVTLGATLAVDEGHFQIATRILDQLRWIVFGTGKFQPPAPLWCLQTLLLIQAQEKMFSTRKHHEMAHIFHGAIITLMKRGTAYSATSSSQPEQPCTELEQSWLRWVSDEASKRTAFFAFIMDAQHTFLFGHTCVLSAHDVQLTLPCADFLWEQQTPQAWREVSRQTPEPPRFLPTLKGLLAKTPLPETCSSYARFIVLHGLFSVIANLHARDNATLGVGRPASSSSSSDSSSSPHAMEFWKEVLERAIDTWFISKQPRGPSGPSLSLEASRILHPMAHVAIYTNIIDFHIVAGAPPLLGTPLSRHDYTKAKTRLRAWSAKLESKKALYHCLRLVQDTVLSEWRYRASEDNIALRSWCLYHATLVVWAYGHILEENEMWENQRDKKRKRAETNDGIARPGLYPKLEADAGRKDPVLVGAQDYVGRMLPLLDELINRGSSSSSSASYNTTNNNDNDNDNRDEKVKSSSSASASSSSRVAASDMLLSCATQTRDLILLVRQSLANCRWILLQEAYVTLGKLVGISVPAGSDFVASNSGSGLASSATATNTAIGAWK